MDVLSITGLSVAYGDHEVVSELDLSLPRGATVGLLGPNGAGKTTVLHSIVGLAVPASGVTQVDGLDSSTLAAKDLIGFAPDDLPTPLSLTGAETIALYSRLRSGLVDTELAHWLAGLFDLTGHLDKAVGAYSHGMRRKLSLICAVSHHPDLLILDEPLRGLDPEAATILHALLDVVRNYGGSVLMATHDLDGAARYCDQVTVMASSRAVASGTPEQVQAMAGGAASLSDAFLVLSGLADRLNQQRSEILRKFSSPDESEAAS